MNLINLTIGKNFEYDIPNCIKKLSIYNNTRHIEYLSENVEELYLSNKYKFVLINLLNSIKKLNIYCQNVENIFLPKNTKYLTIYSHIKKIFKIFHKMFKLVKL